MCDRERIVGRDLQQQIPVTELVLQAIDRECRERAQPVRRRARSPSDESRPEREGDREPGGREGKFGFRIGERGPALSEPLGVVAQDAHEAAQPLAIDVAAQIERDERAVSLGIRVDPRLVDAVERDDLVSVERHGGGSGRCGV